MKKNLVYKILIATILLLICDQCFAGGIEKLLGKIFKPLEKNGGKHIEEAFRYFKLMGVLYYIKSISWSKMLIGSSISIIGALYPTQETSKDNTSSVQISKFKIYFKGSLKFALIIAGIIIIISAAIDGFKEKEKYERQEMEEHKKSPSIKNKFANVYETTIQAFIE